MSARKAVLWPLLGLLLVFLLGPAPAQANRQLEKESALSTNEDPKVFQPPPEGQIEGACGIAVSPTTGDLYVSDYYHHVVDVFNSVSGAYKSQFAVNQLNGVCQLAFDSTGNLYANEWHERVLRLKTTTKVFDEAESTGVAVDSTGQVYVNDRTQISVYEPSGGVAIQEIGIGNLQDAYGLAVFAGRVYVPDAATKTVKVFEPAVSLSTPQATIAPPGGFKSLVDATVAVDPTNGHVIVIDNLQPGFEHPKAAIDEFGSNGAFLGQLKKTVIDGEPSGVAISAAGTLYVTSGNSEKANALKFGPYTESGPEAVETPPEAPESLGGVESGTSTAAVAPAIVAPAVTSASQARSTARAAARRRTARKSARLRARHRREQRLAAQRR
jgi:hypothetical protein